MGRARFIWASLLVLLVYSPCNAEEKRPAWIDGESPFYSEQEYLTGVGTGSSRIDAENQAYAAISKIFRAQIQSQARDAENYRQKREKGKTEIRSTINLNRTTEVSTQKILENVRISENWEDPLTHVHYALATLFRSQAVTSLTEKIQALDKEVLLALDRFEKGNDPLLRWKALRQAERMLALREAYNGDLRIIRRSGAGIDPPVSPASIEERSNRFLSDSFHVSLLSSGPEGEALLPALSEGLTKQGFHILQAEKDGDLTVRAEGQMEEEDLQNRDLKFVRWEVRLELIYGKDGKVVATAGRTGREGHLTLVEAGARARRAMQREVSGPLIDELFKVVEGTEE